MWRRRVSFCNAAPRCFHKNTLCKKARASLPPKHTVTLFWNQIPVTWPCESQRCHQPVWFSPKTETGFLFFKPATAFARFAFFFFFFYHQRRSQGKRIGSSGLRYCLGNQVQLTWFHFLEMPYDLDEWENAGGQLFLWEHCTGAVINVIIHVTCQWLSRWESTAHIHVIMYCNLISDIIINK